MTIPAHPDLDVLLHQVATLDPGVGDLVTGFPGPASPRFVDAVLTLWQALAEHAPAASVLAEVWITGDTGWHATAHQTSAISISIDHPDPTLQVQLSRCLDTHRLAADLPAAARKGGPDTAAATLPALAGSLTALEVARDHDRGVDPLALDALPTALSCPTPTR